MGRKKKKTVWHKKRGKFVPSSVLKPHGKNPSGGENIPKAQSKKQEERKKVFWKNLTAQIGKAVHDNFEEK